MPHGLVNQRAKPEVQFLQGYFPETVHPSAMLAPCFDETNRLAIKSGMVVSLFEDAGVPKWKRGLIAGKTPYIAVHDGTSPNAQSPGNLLAIPMSDQLTLLTGYYGPAAITDFVLDTPLSAYSDASGDAGNLKVAANGEVVVARVSQKSGNAGSIKPVANTDWRLVTDSGSVDPSMICVSTLFSGLLKA